MNGFLGIGNGHSEQRTSAGGNPPATPESAARDPIFIAWDPAGGPESAIVYEMASTPSSRLAIRNIRVFCEKGAHMDTTTVGTCSLCGGRVTVPTAWYSTVPPVPTCSDCGAQRKQPYGPIIEMERPAETPRGRFADATLARLRQLGWVF